MADSTKRRMRCPRRALVAAAGILAAALTMSACSGSSGSSSDNSTGQATSNKTEISAALTGDPPSLSPFATTDLPAINVFRNVFDGLTQIKADGTVGPQLASKWTVSADAKTWVFTLRDDAKWQDGSAVTPADVVWTFQTAMADTKNSLHSATVSIDSISATGANEVTIKLKQSYSTFPNEATLVPILPQKIYTSMGADAFGNKPIGSGPYQVASFTRGTSIELTRFDGYWGPKGNFAKVTFKPVLDDTTRVNALVSGSLDVGLVAPTSIAAAKASPKLSVVAQEANRVVYVGMNAQNPQLSNESVRKAINLAINRAEIASKLQQGLVKPTGQMLAPSVQGYDPSIKAPDFDLDQAKQLVASSGYDGTPITLTYPMTGLPQIDQMAQAIAGYLDAAGIKVKLDGEEQNAFQLNYLGGKFTGMWMYLFAPSTMAADFVFTALFWSKSGHGYIKDSTMDELVTQDLAESDETARVATSQKIEQLAAEKSYFAPLYVDAYNYGVTKGLNWTPRPDGLLMFQSGL